MPKLIVKFKDRELQECAVGFDPVTIGRLPDNMIVIDNDVVSGRHARVLRDGNHYVVEDLQSRNGTFVNNKAIWRHTLLDGDVVVVGKHSLVFTLASGEQAAPEPAPDQFVPDIGGTTVFDPRAPEGAPRKSRSRTAVALGPRHSEDSGRCAAARRISTPGLWQDRST